MLDLGVLAALQLGDLHVSLESARLRNDTSKGILKNLIYCVYFRGAFPSSLVNVSPESQLCASEM